MRARDAHARRFARIANTREAIGANRQGYATLWLYE